MPQAPQPPSIRSHHVLLFALSLVLAAAGAGVAVFGASAGTGAYPRHLALELSSNASGSAQLNANDPLVQAAAGAEAVAKSSGLRAALGNFWRLVWEKSWPFLKSLVIKFFGLFGSVWRAIMHASVSTNANAAVNAPVNVNADASVNTSTNAP